MPEEISLRKATEADVPELLRHRRGMFLDMGETDAAALDKMEAGAGPLIARGLREGFFHAWLALTPERRVVGGGAVHLPLYPASTRELKERRPCILNVFVDAEFRRKGVARRLMEEMVGWCRTEGYASVYLHASEQGRPLYISMGFEPTNEMRLDL